MTSNNTCRSGPVPHNRRFRIMVVVGLLEQDAMLALGVVPVATTEWFGEQPGAIFPWATDELGDAEPPEVLTDLDGIDFERIAGLRPDLILGIYSALSEQDYRTLSRIAPTVAPSGEYADFLGHSEATRVVGQALGRQARAEQLVAQVFTRSRSAALSCGNAAGVVVLEPVLLSHAPRFLGLL